LPICLHSETRTNLVLEVDYHVEHDVMCWYDTKQATGVLNHSTSIGWPSLASRLQPGRWLGLGGCKI